MRTDIDFALGELNTFYLKSGENIYEFSGIDNKLSAKYWEEIKEGNLLVSEKHFAKKKIIDFLHQINAFDTADNFPKVLNYRDKNLNDYTVGVCGDVDLVNYFLNIYPSNKKLLNIKEEDEGYNFGLILTRRFNKKKQIELNEKLFLNNKPYCALIFDQLNFSIGPQIIPKHTSCLNCKNIHENNNNFYGNILDKFNYSEKESVEYIPEELLNLGISFAETQIVKYQLQEEDISLETELVQKVVEYSFLQGIWQEHNVLKNPRCKLCFPSSVWDEQIFEVNPN